MNLKKIIVPVDFTESSFQSIEVAAQIAKKNNSTISLIYVVDIPYEGKHGDTGMSGSVADVGIPTNFGDEEGEEKGGFYYHMLPDARDRMDQIKAKYNGVNFEEHVKTDMYQRHLHKFITKEPADLVVLKTSGRTDPDHSKAADIIRYSPSPVLTLHGKVKEFSPKEIVFASNFQDVPQKTVTFIRDFQKLYDATIHLLTIITPGVFTSSKENFRRMNEFQASHGFTDAKTHVFAASEIAEGVVDFSELVGGDLLMMNTHGRTGISHWLFGSAAESVAVYSKLPVMTFNQHFKD